MAPYLVDTPPWLKSGPFAVPEAMHHFYLAQSYVASVSAGRAERELEQAIKLEPSNPKFYLLQMKILLDQDKSSEGGTAALAALERDKNSISDVLAMSDEFYLPDAKKVYAKVIAMGSHEVLPYLGLGNIALHSMILRKRKVVRASPGAQTGASGSVDGGGRLLAAKGNAKEAKELWRSRKPRRRFRDHLRGNGIGLFQAQNVGQRRRILPRSFAHEKAQERLAIGARAGLRAVGKDHGGGAKISRSSRL
jgi:hypothetical protein